MTIDIPRPAIPSAVISLITRKETGDRPSQMGDVIADDVGGGVVVLSSITPTGAGPGGVGPQARAEPDALLPGAGQGRARCRPSPDAPTISPGRGSMPSWRLTLPSAPRAPSVPQLPPRS